MAEEELPTCADCLEEIKENEFAVVENEKYHVHHFLCSKCQQELVNIKYLKQNDKFFCEDCYVKTFAQECAICLENITGGYVNLEEDKYIHEECFTCATCSNVISQDDGYYQLDDQQFQCAKCCQGDSKVCQGCNAVIETEEQIKFMENQYYHPECFKCSVCNTQIADQSFTSQNDLPIHDKCLVRPICQICNLEIKQDVYLEKNNEFFHSECVEKKSLEQDEELKQSEIYTAKLALKPAQQKNQQQQQQSEQQYENSVYVEAKNKLKPVTIQNVENKKQNDIDSYKKIQISKSDNGQQDQDTPIHLIQSRMRYTYKELTTQPFPSGIDLTKREAYLTDEEFEKLFKKTFDEFYEQKDWKQIKQKQDLKLF